MTILDLEFTRVKERMSAKSFEEFLVKQEAAAAHKRALVQVLSCGPVPAARESESACSCRSAKSGLPKTSIQRK